MLAFRPTTGWLVEKASRSGQQFLGGITILKSFGPVVSISFSCLCYLLVMLLNGFFTLFNTNLLECVADHAFGRDIDAVEPAQVPAIPVGVLEGSPPTDETTLPVRIRQGINRDFFAR